MSHTFHFSWLTLWPSLDPNCPKYRSIEFEKKVITQKFLCFVVFDPFRANFLNFFNETSLINERTLGTAGKLKPTSEIITALRNSRLYYLFFLPVLNRCLIFHFDPLEVFCPKIGNNFLGSNPNNFETVPNYRANFDPPNILLFHTSIPYN